MAGERDNGQTGAYWMIRPREWYPHYAGSSFKGLVKSVESARGKHKLDILNNPRHIIDLLKDGESWDVVSTLYSVRHEFRIGDEDYYLDLNVNGKIQ